MVGVPETPAELPKIPAVIENEPAILKVISSRPNALSRLNVDRGAERRPGFSAILPGFQRFVPSL